MKLKDVCTKIGSGATPRGGKDAYKKSGISLIRSQNVLDYAFSRDGLAYIDDAQACQLDNVNVEKGDVLLNITGDSVARACLVDEHVLPARVNQHVAIVRGNPSMILQSYILYHLQMKKADLLQLASGGATRNALTKAMIENIDIEVPSISIQQRIVAALDAIQDKISVNRKINDYLAKQIDAIFRAWFIEFIPFGYIRPSEWNVVEFSRFLKTRSEKSNDPRLRMYSVTDTGIHPRTEKFKKQLSKAESMNKLIFKNDLVFGMSREILNWGVMHDDIGGVSSAYNVFAVDTFIDIEYLETFIKTHMQYFRDLIRPAAREGQGIDKAVLMKKQLLYPSKDVLTQYHILVSPFQRYIEKNLLETKN